MLPSDFVKQEELRFQLSVILLDRKSLWKRFAKTEQNMKDLAEMEGDGGKDGES